MQDKNQSKTKQIILDIVKYLNVKNIQGLAKALGENPNKIYAWIKNGKIGDTGAILGKCPEIRKEWLETGEGEMFLKPPPPDPGLIDAAENERIVHDMLKRVYGWDAGEVITSLTALPRSARMKILAQMFEAIEEEDKKKREEE